MSKAKYTLGVTEDSGNIAGSNDYLLDRKGAAKFLGVKEHTLAVWSMSNKYHLPYVKVGRLVKYRMSDLRDFLEQNLHR